MELHFNSNLTRYVFNETTDTCGVIEVTTDFKTVAFHELVNGRSVFRCYCTPEEMKDRLQMWGYN